MVAPAGRSSVSILNEASLLEAIPVDRAYTSFPKIYLGRSEKLACGAVLWDGVIPAALIVIYAVWSWWRR